MDESSLPPIIKPETETSSAPLAGAVRVDSTCDLSSVLGADDTLGVWNPLSPTPAEREVTDDLQAVIAMRVTYRGEPFCGFAKQPGQLTVQGSLEEALAKVFRHPVETVCAGRTDSGVHARGQWVSFSLSAKEWNERSDYKVLKSLNALTHEDISICEIMRKDLDFNARFSARSREYRYFICTDKPAPLLMRDFSWHLGKELDLEAMRKAASYLIGEHDFRSFCMAASAEGKTTNRNVVSIDIDEIEMWGENLVVITVVGNAFLHSMVRTIVGTLVLVGRGKREPEWVAEVLAACDRCAAGENAPAQGLVFWQVNYDGELIYDPDAKRKEARAKELAEAEAKAKAEKKFHLFGGTRFGGGAEFAIPRGVPREEGQLPFSGASMSDVKTKKGDTDSFNPLEVDALRNPTNKATEAGSAGDGLASAAVVQEAPEPSVSAAPVSRSSSVAPASTKFASLSDGATPASVGKAAQVRASVSSIQTPAAAYTETGAYGDLEWDIDLEEAKQSSKEEAPKKVAIPEIDTTDVAGERESNAPKHSTPSHDLTAPMDPVSAKEDSEPFELAPASAKHGKRAPEEGALNAKHGKPREQDDPGKTAAMPALDGRYPFETRPLPYQLKD
ncbi:MAG: tRNA pseudouridine(38-40) synthase TruA [Coriobacteriia bacterium]|nr:tRNA pseudouridine(38-40) synthase TruA [Coriobacteriia bacterium]